MAAKTLKDAFLDELRDTYDAERQLVKALPRLAKAASSEELAEALTSHLEETKGQVDRLESAFEALGEKVRGKHCDGMAGIIEEGKTVLEEDFEDATLDAVLIASAQRAEHYEMAAYGTLIAWAEALQLHDVVELLEANLEEEKAADEKLSALAESGINAAAMAGDESDEDVEETTSRPAAKKSSSAKRR